MLGMKSFKTAEITLAGIELAHRIRKGQFSLRGSVRRGSPSLKQQWDQALAPGDGDRRPVVAPIVLTVVAPELRRRRAVPSLTEAELREIKSLRYARKIFDGGGLYLIVAPNGGRWWRYDYRFQRKSRTLALGVYPDVSLKKARARREEARRLLADGLDPSTRKHEVIGNARLHSVSADEQTSSFGN
jgi:hypothetical protein